MYNLYNQRGTDEVPLFFCSSKTAYKQHRICAILIMRGDLDEISRKTQSSYELAEHTKQQIGKSSIC